MPLKPGHKAPNFSLPSTGGQFTLDTDASNQPVVLYFYPKDFTRVCTNEACTFRDNFDFFKTLDVLVLGISTDPVEKHQAFKSTHQLPFELLADVDGRVSKAYKAHIPFLNLSRRVTYLLDKEHVVAAVYSDFFEAEGHIEEMIAQLK
ncbi:Redoxin domain protein [Fulvivirga imtechensis AK7]|uniref:thioredoxin-dependent peroxiredoxin n=1 Tax=Fulvivirga imtechensis AK7 TaxID=1237149 RepID=L8JNT5_9BACT|nr:peroxiredoxin [Fulvivirga imtechensis]ELR70626.1 Redoxin domain protein [Fulvivirga imtechensis AK7]